MASPCSRSNLPSTVQRRYSKLDSGEPTSRAHDLVVGIMRSTTPCWKGVTHLLPQPKRRRWSFGWPDNFSRFFRRY
jgi:hypothetical protein